jgi:hypothetical protein
MHTTSTISIAIRRLPRLAAVLDYKPEQFYLLDLIQPSPR